MTPASAPAPDTVGRRLLDQWLATEATPSAVDVTPLAALPPATLEETLWAFARDHGAGALGLLSALADHTTRTLRRPARRVIYRLAQRGVTAPPAPAPRPLVARGGDRPIRAWLSGIDGRGSRASWILFEGAFGTLRLCSLILNDEIGILDAAGGDITRKRLERELGELAASQKLPWVETDPERAAGLVAEALAHHRDAATAPPAAFERWRSLFEGVRAAGPPTLPPADPALVERSATLLDLPELTGWFLEPEHVQADAVEMLQARESRLVVSDQIKAERQEALITRIVERELTPEARARWTRRLSEMALVFSAVGREEHAALTRAAAAALADETLDAYRHPLARGLAARALEVAGEVALGRLPAAEATRQPKRTS
jgi:hypothetical protein